MSYFTGPFTLICGALLSTSVPSAGCVRQGSPEDSSPSHDTTKNPASANSFGLIPPPPVREAWQDYQAYEFPAVLAPTAEDNLRFAPQRIQVDVRTMNSNDLIDLYERVEREGYLWAAGEREKLLDEFRERRDPKLDDKLIAWFERVMKKDSDDRRLDSFAGKRVGTSTEDILCIIGSRGTKRALDYVASQATNKHPIVRGTVIDALGTDGLFAPDAGGRMSRVAALLTDYDANVAFRSVWGLTESLRALYLESPNAAVHRFNTPTFRLEIGAKTIEAAIHYLIDAQDRTPPGTKVHSRGRRDDIHEVINENIESCAHTLTRFREKAGPEERMEVDRLLDIIRNRKSAHRGLSKSE